MVMALTRPEVHDMSGDFDIASAFDAGNFVAVAFKGSPSDWRYHAARGLLVDPQTAIQRLNDFDHPEARFYQAVLTWFTGDEDAACRGLERVSGEHAAALLRLIRKPRIEVLSQMPPMRDGAFVLLSGIANDRKFSVRNIGDGAGDLKNPPYTPLSAHFDPACPPDYFVCSNIEWHNSIPVDLGNLPFPTIGYTSDFDAHILTTAPWLRAFDIAMVCDHVYEWEKVRALSPGMVYAYPLIFGAPRNLPPIKRRERDIDVFMSGTMTSVYHPDKAKLINQLLACKDIKMLLFEGHVGLNEYFELTSRAKITQSFCRHPGAMLTRAIESLSLGSMALVQEDSVNRLWGGEERGIFTFDVDAGPVETIRRILKDPSRHVAACEANAMRIRETFSAQRIASQFFRFCAVAAAKPRRRHTSQDTVDLNQKRHIFILGPRPSLTNARELADSNVKHLQALDAEKPDVRHKNDIAREIALLRGQARYFNETLGNDSELHAKMIQSLEDAVEAEPRRLVPCFNLLRLLICFGDAAEVRRGLKLAASVIDRPLDQWQVDPLDDVFPYDFSGSWFNSREYFDCLVEVLGGDAGKTERLRRLILASIHHYLAVDKESLTLAEAAHSLDPDFPFYSLHLAEILSRQTDAAALRRARGLLTTLADSSCVSWRALQMIKSIDDRFGESPSDRMVLDDRMATAGRSLIIHEHHAERLSSSFVHRMRMRSGGKFGRTVHKTAHSRRSPRLSIVVLGQAGYRCKAVLDAIAHQTADRTLFEVIYIECFDMIAPGLLHLADTVISCNQERFFEHRSVALNIAREFACGEILAVVEPDMPPDTRFVERVLGVFFQAPNEPVGKRKDCARVALIGGWDREKKSASRFIAVQKSDFDRIGGFDEHEIFAGDSAPALEFLWRLQLAGTPIFDAGADEATLITLPPWWELPPIVERPLILSAARLIWPRLCEENRIEPLLRIRYPAASLSDHGREVGIRSAISQSAAGGDELLLSYCGYNIIRNGGRIIGARQSLGPIDPNFSAEQFATRFGRTDVFIRDSLDGMITAIDLARIEEKTFVIQSGFVRQQLRRLLKPLKPSIGRELRRIGFRIDDPNSRAGRIKQTILRICRF